MVALSGDSCRRFGCELIESSEGSLAPVLRVVVPMPPANDRQTRRFEVLVGRSLAICVHPRAAWRSRSTSYRAALLFAYFSLAYMLVFALLNVLPA